MSALPSEILQRIAVGPAGWSYPDWHGTFYPADSATNRCMLPYVIRYFDTVEINSTFYRMPNLKTVENWLQISKKKESFSFCVKIWQGFTHSSRVAEPAMLESFSRVMQPLHENNKLGAVLIQYPWRTKYCEKNLADLTNLCSALAGLPLVIEFRHNSWNTVSLMDTLRQLGVGFVNIDQPLIGNSLPPTDYHTSSVAYFRFHGRNRENWFNESAGRDDRYNYLYSPAELDAWIPAISQCAEKAKKTFIIFNNHFRGQAVVNSFQMKEKLTGLKQNLPDSLVSSFPVLRSITADTADGQTGLFPFLV